MRKELFSELTEYLKGNKGKVLGGIFGFLIGILILVIGFFKTMFIILCTWLGLLIGSKAYGIEDIKKLLERLLSPTKRI
ncbi:DUF2273 domain-containing protein [Clostridium sp. Cult2]|uniref:DUF2273 domain-containing protein n=1 Tax=Clostridium sp. Cult2 TaxID=2079003 RepID=UPI001F370DA6|nr:DUF2273 domain-containing protein [Clostridium sp. Cult2]MCF6465613.1 hypothetical protein [Clostridium sp. Cult2]